MDKFLILSDHAEMSARVRALIEEAHPALIPAATFATSAEIDVKQQGAELIATFPLVFSVHCKQIFPPALVNGTRCINLHPGYNPYNRGWFPHVFSIINGLPAGATLHVMDEQVDHGPIIAQTRVTVRSFDTSGSLYARILDAEIGLLDRHLPALVSGDYAATPPTFEGNINTRRDYEALKRISLHEQGSFQVFYDRLRALSHGDYWNAQIVDDYGTPACLRLMVQDVDATEYQTPAQCLDS